MPLSEQMKQLSPSQKLRRKKLYMRKYLIQLSVLSNRAITENDLSSVAQAEDMRSSFSKFGFQPVTEFDIDFQSKSTERFRKYIDNLLNSNPSMVSIWTHYTIHCGLIFLPDISCVNFLFEFDIDENGVLIFPTIEFEDRILLDLYTANSGEKRLKVETHGNRWSNVIY